MQQNRIIDGDCAEFTAALPDLRQLVRNLCDAFRAQGVGNSLADNIRIALSEAINNIIEHAYLAQRDGLVTLRLEMAPDTIRITLIDRGAPLPALKMPEGKRPPLPQNRAMLPEGGFGWFLIRTLAADVQYERRGGCNRLTLRFDRTQ